MPSFGQSSFGQFLLERRERGGRGWVWWRGGWVVVSVCVSGWGGGSTSLDGRGMGLNGKFLFLPA